MHSTESIIKIITESEKALAFDVELEYLDEEEGFCAEFSYQIDDRIDRDDEEIKNIIQSKLGDDYGVIVDRVDAFPNGFAAYKVTIDM